MLFAPFGASRHVESLIQDISDDCEVEVWYAWETEIFSTTSPNYAEPYHDRFSSMSTVGGR